VTRRSLLFSLVLCPLALGSWVHGQEIAKPVRAKQRISVEDLSRFAVIGDPNSLSWNDYHPRIAAFSPNGECIAVVVRHGNPDKLTNDANLLVYDATTLLTDPHPQVLASFSSATKYEPIALVRWLADRRTIVFAGSQGNQGPQVYRLDVHTGKLRQLTHLSTTLYWFDITPSGDQLVTESEPPITAPGNDQRCLTEGCLVTAKTLLAAERGEPESAASLVMNELKTGKQHVIPAPETHDPDLVDCQDDLKGGLSPDGRFGLRICKLRSGHWPSWWGEYTAYPEMQAAIKEGRNGFGRQWVLIDFLRGSSRRLTEAPYLTGYLSDVPPLWIDGGRHVILPGAFEPLAGVDEDERAQRSSHYAVLMIDPNTLTSERIVALGEHVNYVKSAQWDETTQTLTINSMPPSSVVCRREDGKWVSDSVPLGSSNTTKTTEKIQLLIDQSLNNPPVLLAVDPKSGLRKHILDPNPWLAQRRLGRIELIRWKAKDGHEWRGGLYYPPDYQPGVHYPLVLQTHGFNDKLFSLNGIARNFPGEALAAQDIIVLQVGENTEGVLGPEVWSIVQGGYEGAIDYLDSLGLIDRNRVGIQGWSASGPWEGYTLTHSTYRFAAGAFTDTGDYGWWWYLTQGAQHVEADYGAAPFGEGLDVWRKLSPSFNLDRIRTPMLMWEAVGVAGLWDWYAGLRRLGKPVEYWFLPDGTHDVFKVGERLRTNHLLVDWFCFWLKGEEDPNPKKSEQYRRWREFQQSIDGQK